MYRQPVVNLLHKLFAWSVVDPRDIDDEKYLFAKKFSEVMASNDRFVCLLTSLDDIKSRRLYRAKECIYTKGL
jgi:hypothetical protein